MSQIHITDGQSDRILDVVSAQYIIDDLHKQSLEDTLETYDFTTFADKRFSQYLEKRNRVIIPGEDGEYREFIIEEAIKSMNRQTEVYATASYLELKKQAVIYPQTFDEQTATQMVSHATNGTEWVPGIIEVDAYRTFRVEKHKNPYSFLKTIANEFDAELRFRVATDGKKVTRRYVDLLERRGKWQGREVEFGRDLQSIKRTERTDNIYTALVGIGPERDDGTRLEVTVEDEDALKRWGRRDKQTGELQHLIGTYEPQSSRTEMTEEELRQYTRTELNKRINEVVEYESKIVDLENVPGMENKKIRFGDTIKIKDTGFNPALYLEARVFDQERSIVDKSAKTVKLGDYTEYTEEEVTAIWQQLQNRIREKLDAAEMREYTYDKLTIDDKDTTVFEEGKTFAQLRADDARAAAEAVAEARAELAQTQAEAYADGIVSDEEQARIDQAKANLQEAKEDAEQKANAAESAAKGHADDVASDAEQSAKDHADTVSGQALIDAQNYAVAQQVYDTKMTEIAGDLADKSSIEYVDGQLVDKANKGDVYTIDETDNMLLNYVGLTEYETDMDGVVRDLNTHSTLIGQNEDAIGLKADSSRVDTIEGTVGDHSASLNVMSDEINQKVEADYVQGEIDALQFGVRNLFRNGSFEDFNVGETYNSYTSNLSSCIISNDYAKEGVKSLKVVPSVAGDNIIRIFSNGEESFIHLNDGETVTTSIWIYPLEDTSLRIGINESQQTGTIESKSVIGGEWNEVTLTHTRNSVYENYWLFLQHFSTTLYIDCVMVAYGNKVSDWTPAPEDTQSQIDDLDITVSSQSTEIQQNASAITSKAESSVVDTLTGRVSTTESEIQQQADELSSKIDDGQARSIFTQEADSFTFDAGQINFDGHVFGEDATFAGALEAATGTFGGTVSGANIEGSRFYYEGADTNTIMVIEEGGIDASVEMSWRSYQSYFTPTNVTVDGTNPNDGSLSSATLADGNLSGTHYDSDFNIVSSFHLTAGSGTSLLTVDEIEANREIHNNGNGIFMNEAGRVHNSGDGETLIQGDSVTVSEYLASALTSIRAREFQTDDGALGRIVTTDSNGGRMYVQANGDVSATQYNSGTLVPVRASDFYSGSLAEYKQDINPWKESALDLINGATIYDYRLISEIEDGINRKRQGLVIGDGYNTPEGVINGDGVEQYRMNSWSWKAVQELSDMYYEHDEDINWLKMENQLLKSRVNKLEEAS